MDPVCVFTDSKKSTTLTGAALFLDMALKSPCLPAPGRDTPASYRYGAESSASCMGCRSTLYALQINKPRELCLVGHKCRYESFPLQGDDG